MPADIYADPGNRVVPAISETCRPVQKHSYGRRTTFGTSARPGTTRATSPPAGIANGTAAARCGRSWQQSQVGWSLAARCFAAYAPPGTVWSSRRSRSPCGRVAVRRGCPARPAVCRPDQARRSLPLHPEDRYEARRAGLQLAGPREVPLPMSGRTIGPLTRQLTPADRGYRTCAALGRAPGTRDQAYGKSLAAPASCRGRGASAPGPAPAPGP